MGKFAYIAGSLVLAGCIGITAMNDIKISYHYQELNKLNRDLKILEELLARDRAEMLLRTDPAYVDESIRDYYQNSSRNRPTKCGEWTENTRRRGLTVSDNSNSIKMVYIDIDTGREVDKDWGQPFTVIDGMLSGKEPMVNGVNKYRRILIRRNPGFIPTSGDPKL